MDNLSQSSYTSYDKPLPSIPTYNKRLPATPQQTQEKEPSQQGQETKSKDLKDSLHAQAGVNVVNKSSGEASLTGMINQGKALSRDVLQSGNKENVASAQDTVNQVSFAQPLGSQALSEAQMMNKAKPATSIGSMNSVLQTAQVPATYNLLIALKKDHEETCTKISTAEKKLGDLKEKIKNNPTDVTLKKELTSLQNELEALNSKKETLSKSIVLSSTTLISSIASSTQSISGTMGEMISSRAQSLTKICTATNQGGGSAGAIVSAVASLISLANSALDYTKAHEKLKLAQDKLSKLPENSPERPKIAKEIKELQDECQKHMEACQVNYANSVGGIIGTASSIIQTVAKTTHLGSHASAVLGTVSGVGGAATGAIGAAVSAKQIVDCAKKSEKLDKEITRLQEEKTKRLDDIRGKCADPNQDILVRLLDLKIKNLKYQQEDNIVSIIKNSVALSSSVLGTTATILGVVGATAGAAAIVGSTMGFGAIALAGAAIGIGAGYYIYTNRKSIAARAELTLLEANLAKMNVQLHFSNAEKSEKEQKIAHLMDQSMRTTEHYNQWPEIQLNLVDQMSSFGEILDAKNQALQQAKGNNDKEGISQITKDIEMIKQTMDKLNQINIEINNAHALILEKTVCMNKAVNIGDKIDKKMEELKNASPKEKEKISHEIDILQKDLQEVSQRAIKLNQQEMGTIQDIHKRMAENNKKLKTVNDKISSLRENKTKDTTKKTDVSDRLKILN